MDGQILSFMPDWLLFSVILLIAIIVYTKLPDELKNGIKSFFKGYGVYLILFLFWFYFRNKWGIVAENEFFGQMRLATFLLGLGGLLYFGVKSWLYEQRYYTHFAIANNRHGSCHRYQEMGDWIILFIGGSGTSDERFVIPWPWVKEIWVVPKCAVQFLGNQIFVLTQLDKNNYMEVDEEITNFIKADTFARWHLDDVYFGVWSEQIKSKDPKFSEIQEMLKKQCERTNEIKEMLKGKLSITKTFISDTFGMTEKIKGKDWRRNESRPREE